MRAEMVDETEESREGDMGEEMIDIQIDDIFIDLVDSKMLVSLLKEACVICERQGTVTLVITDDNTVQQLNRDYRNVDTPTDVLSFAAQDTSSDPSMSPAIHDLPTELAATLEQYLGDIIIAYPYAMRQAAAYGNNVDAELRLLAVHGLLHLLGYDHSTAEEEAEMWALQRKILAHYGDPDLSERVYQ